jgi:hypothetical protein
MGTSNEISCEGLNSCMTLVDDYQFDYKKIIGEKTDVQIILKSTDGYCEIIIKKVFFNLDLKNFIDNINKILKNINRIDDFKLKVLKNATKHVLEKHISNDEKKKYFDLFSLVKKNDDMKELILSFRDLFTAIYENRYKIGLDKMTFFIESIKLFLEETKLVNDEDFFSYLKDIFIDKKMISERESQKDTQNNNNENNNNLINDDSSSNLNNNENNNNQTNNSNNNNSNYINDTNNTFVKELINLLSRYNIKIEDDLMNVYKSNGSVPTNVNENGNS